MLDILRTVDNFELNKGIGMANGLYNISDKENSNKLSLWFDKDTKEELMQMSNSEFKSMAKDICK